MPSASSSSSSTSLDPGETSNYKTKDNDNKFFSNPNNENTINTSNSDNTKIQLSRGQLSIVRQLMRVEKERVNREAACGDRRDNLKHNKDVAKQLREMKDKIIRSVYKAGEQGLSVILHPHQTHAGDKKHSSTTTGTASATFEFPPEIATSIGLEKKKKHMHRGRGKCDNRMNNCDSKNNNNNLRNEMNININNAHPPYGGIPHVVSPWPFYGRTWESCRSVQPCGTFGLGTSIPPLPYEPYISVLATTTVAAAAAPITAAQPTTSTRIKEYKKLGAVRERRRKVDANNVNNNTQSYNNYITDNTEEEENIDVTDGCLVNRAKQRGSGTLLRTVSESGLVLHEKSPRLQHISSYTVHSPSSSVVSSPLTGGSGMKFMALPPPPREGRQCASTTTIPSNLLRKEELPRVLQSTPHPQLKFYCPKMLPAPPPLCSPTSLCASTGCGNTKNTSTTDIELCPSLQQRCCTPSTTPASCERVEALFPPGLNLNVIPACLNEVDHTYRLHRYVPGYAIDHRQQDDSKLLEMAKQLPPLHPTSCCSTGMRCAIAPRTPLTAREDSRVSLSVLAAFSTKTDDGCSSVTSSENIDEGETRSEVCSKHDTISNKQTHNNNNNNSSENHDNDDILEYERVSESTSCASVHNQHEDDNISFTTSHIDTPRQCTWLPKPQFVMSTEVMRSLCLYDADTLGASLSFLVRRSGMCIQLREFTPENEVMEKACRQYAAATAAAATNTTTVSSLTEASHYYTTFGSPMFPGSSGMRNKSLLAKALAVIRNGFDGVATAPSPTTPKQLPCSPVMAHCSDNTSSCFMTSSPSTLALPPSLATTSATPSPFTITPNIPATEPLHRSASMVSLASSGVVAHTGSEFGGDEESTDNKILPLALSLQITGSLTTTTNTNKTSAASAATPSSPPGYNNIVAWSIKSGNVLLGGDLPLIDLQLSSEHTEAALLVLHEVDDGRSMVIPCSSDGDDDDDDDYSNGVENPDTHNRSNCKKNSKKKNQLCSSRAQKCEFSLQDSEALRIWFDASLANVRCVALVAHRDGIVQCSKLVRTVDVLQGVPHSSMIVNDMMKRIQELLEWLAEASTEDGEYVLLREGDQRLKGWKLLRLEVPATTEHHAQ